MCRAIVIDRLLPEGMVKEIEDVILGFRFPWFYYPNTNARDLTTNDGDAPQFVHGFIQGGKPFSEWASLPTAIARQMGLEPADIIRAKANMLGRELKPLTHPPHTDDESPHWVLIYYINDADGDTCLYENGEVAERITPKRGRGVVFDGSTVHASSSPTQTPFRCVFNFNLRKHVPRSLFENLSGK